MDKLKAMLSDGCLGVVRARNGELRWFTRRGVVDLLELSETNPEFLNGAYIADKVIGRGAALLLVRGNVAQVYAQVISSGALKALQHAGIAVEFGKETPYIINRKGDGMCPVESLTATTDDPDEAFKLIKSFINK